MARTDEVWKSEALVQTFLQGVRGGIPLAAEQIDVMLRLIAACNIPIDRFADLGCGNGVLAGAILARYPQARGDLIDFSEPMLAQARLELQAQAAQVRFVTADLALADWAHTVADHAPFDVIVSGFAIHHLQHIRKQQLYREVFDLLRAGGVFVNVEHVASQSARDEVIFHEYMIDSLYEFHSRTGSGKSRAQVTDDYLQRSDKAANILAPVEMQCAWLRDIGYQDVDCYLKIFELAVFAGRCPAERGAP
jgi:tRNA (cmo5U34)-methyltransferase